MDNQFFDRNEFETLSRSLSARLRRRGVEGHTAEDAIQEAWFRTLRGRRTRPEQLLEWLRVVSERVLTEFARKRRAEQTSEAAAARLDALEATLPPDESRVLRLVRELPEPYREVVRLRFVDEAGVEEIARTLQRSEGTVRSQLKRGLERLRARIDEEPERQSWGLAPFALLRRIGRALAARALSSAAFWGAGSVLVALLAVLFWRDVESAPAGRVAELAPAPAASALPSAGTSGERSPLSALSSTPFQMAEPAVFQRSPSGIVRAPDGAPLVGAPVFRSSSDGKRTEEVAVSDELGRYSVARVELMELLWAAHPEHLPSPRTHVASAAEGLPVDLRLETSAGRLELYLYDSHGSPLADSPVELLWDREQLKIEVITTEQALQVQTKSVPGVTDKVGRVVLPKPLRSRASIRVPRVGRPSLEHEIELVPGAQVLELFLSEPLVLSGTVLDEHGRLAPNARVHVLQDDLRWRSDGLADEHGRFRVEGLSPGKCEWRAAEDPARGVATAKGRTVLEESSSAEIRVELSSRLALRGLVLQHGQPFSGARVTRTEPNGERATALSDAGGGFSLPCYDEQECSLDVSVEGRDWPLLELSVRPGESAIELELDEASPLVRRVIEFVSEDPATIPTLVDVFVKELRKAKMLPVERATGRCELSIPLGEIVEATLWIPGLGIWRLGPLDISGPEVRRVEVPRPAHVTFDVALPEHVPSASLQGSLKFSRFGGGLYDPTRAVAVELELAPGPRENSFSARVMPGTYGYTILAKGLAHLPRRVSVGPGATRSVPVRLERGVAVEVNVELSMEENQLSLFFRTSDGLKTAPLNSSDLRLEVGRAFMDVLLPPEAVEIVAETKTLAGSRRIDPLDYPPSGARIEIEMKPKETERATPGRGPR